MTVSSRFAGFLDAPAPDRSLTVPRSPAQAAASRVNGSKSRGPTTEQGKQLIKFNALKHGLYALIAPGHDPKHFHKPLRRIRQQLFVEFGGKKRLTFTATMMIDSLAHDLVQAARARRMIELMHVRPFPIATSTDDRIQLGNYRLLQRARKPLTDAIKALGRGQPARLPGDLVEVVASRLSMIVDATEDVLAPLVEPMRGFSPLPSHPEANVPQPPPVPSPQEQEEVRRAADLKRRCGADWGRFLDVDANIVLLTTTKPPSPRLAKRLRLLLGELIAELEQFSEGIERRMRAQARINADHTLRCLSGDMERLDALQDYLGKIERRIDQRLARITSLQFSGSFFRFPNKC